MVLRLEDTDQTRLVPGAAAALDAMLQWAGIEMNEGPNAGGKHGPYTQSERLPLYRGHADALVASGSAYPCFCTAERLAAVRQLGARTNRLTAYDGACRRLEPEAVQAKLDEGVAHTVRLKTPHKGATTINDLVYGSITFQHTTVDDQVLLKSNGFPTYHLANVVDDHSMGITHVLRGEEWMSSTAKHVLLYRALGWEPPKFAHLPLLVNDDGTKLSKRQGSLHVEELQRQGYLPRALINFSAFLGWRSPGGQQEVYTDIAEMANDFSLEAVARSPAVVDFRKLNNINKQHLALLEPSSSDLADLLPDVRQRVAAAYPAFTCNGNATAIAAADLPKDGSDGTDDGTDDGGNRAQHGHLLLTDGYLESVILCGKTSFETLDQLVKRCGFFWIEPEWSGAAATKLLPKAKAQLAALELLGAGWGALEEDAFADAATLTALLKDAAAEAGTKPGALMPAVRFAVTGTTVGPSICEAVAVIGKTRAMERLVGAILYLKEREAT